MHRTLLTVVCALGCMAGAAPRAQTPAASEYDVKAAYLYNFGKFVQWPPGERRSAESFDICVVGRDPFGAALDRAVTGATIAKRPVQARRLATAAATEGCHVLFVGAPDERRAADLLAEVGRADVLTVGDTPRFLEQGGMIRFYVDGARVRFEVNLASARAVGLNLSSDLLRVATTVRQAGR